MDNLEAYELGILLAGLGLFLWFTIWFFVKRVGQNYSLTRSDVSLIGRGEVWETPDAVIVVESGGRLAAMNHQARKVFHIEAYENPGLERLARWVRPGEAFLALCAKEGKQRFVLDGKLVEGSSYHIASGVNQFVVVSLKPVELTVGSSDAKFGITTQSLKAFTELTVSMTTSLNLEETVRSILENVEKLFSSSYIELSVFDAGEKSLTTYALSIYDGAERALIKSTSEYSRQDKKSIVFEKNRQPLLVSQADVGQEDLEVFQKHPKMQSYLGVPLVFGEAPVGVLELYSLLPKDFQSEDLDLIRLLAEQAAVSIHNARLYETEERRAVELSGLTDLLGAFRSVRDPQEVFSTLIRSISPLVNFDILGFILYNENEGVLAAQVPFKGLPAQIVELYRLKIKPGEPIEKALIDQDMICSENASTDSQWEVFGFDTISRAASMHETVLVPLTTGGRAIGYLQASNHSDGQRPFSEDELRFLSVVADQTAPIIENAILVQQTRARAQRAEVLRRVASLASSDATLDETLTFAVRELANLLRADVAGIFLLGEQGNVLRFHGPSFFRGGNRPIPKVGLLSVEDPQFPFSVTGSRHVLRSGSLAEEQTIIPYYQPILESWDIQSVIAVPLVVRNEGVGELWLGAAQAEHFDQGDLQATVTAAGQLAGVVEQARLFQQTDESLRRRIDQLTALTRINREVSVSLDINHLLRLIHQEALRTTRADSGTILLFEPENHPETLVRYVVGEEHASYLSEGEIQVLKGGEVFLCHSGEGRSVLDPVTEIPYVSALVAPVYSQKQPAGLIILYSFNERAFDTTSVEIAQSLASHTSVVIASVTQRQERVKKGALPAREVKALEVLPDLFEKLKDASGPNEALLEIGRVIREVTDFQMLLFSLFDPQDEHLHRVGHLGLPDEAWEELSEHTQPWGAIKTLLKPEYQHGVAYYVPATQEPILPQEMHTVTGLAGQPEVRVMGDWDPDDMLLVPLCGPRGDVYGLISLDAPLDGRQPDEAVYESLELFAHLSCMVIEHYRQLSSTSNQLSEAVESYHSLKDTEKSLSILLHKDLEQTLSIKTLLAEKEQLQAVYNIVEMANWQPDIPAVLRMMAGELLSILDFQVALIAEQTHSGLQLLDVIQTIDVGSGFEAFFGQKNPLRQVLEDGDAIFVADLHTQSQWRDNPLLNKLSARSFVGLPLLIRSEHVAGILLVGQHPVQEFSEETRGIYIQLARQVSVSLENLDLLTETQRNLEDVNLLLDFSRKLGSLDIDDISRVLLESLMEVIPSADAGWVGLWDEKGQKLSPQLAAGYKDNQRIYQISYASGSASEEEQLSVPIQVLQSGEPKRIKEQEFVAGHYLSSDNLLHYQYASGGLFPLSSLLVPLRSGDIPQGVLVLESFSTSEAFSAAEETMALSLAQQASLALENARLFISAEQRNSQLRALTKVAGTITSSLQSEELINSLLVQLKEVVPYDTATLWLKDKDTLAVAAASGFSDMESRVGLSVAVSDSSIFQEMIRTAEPISIRDISLDERFSSLLELEHHSWLGIPLLAKSELIGVIALEKHETEFYKSDLVQAAMTFAGQAAVSLENAKLYEESVGRTAELDQRTRRLTLLNRFTSKLGASLKVDYILEQTAEYAANAVKASGTAIFVCDEQKSIVLQFETPGSDLELPLLFDKPPIFEQLIESLSVFSSDQVSQEVGLVPLYEMYLNPRGVQSILIVPLSAGANLYGWLLILKAEKHRFSSSEIELERTICNQAAIALQNASLYQETRNLTENLEQRVKERSAQLQQEHQNTETLLQISNELSGSLDTDEVLSRVLKVVNSSLHADQSMIFLHDQKARVYRVGEPIVEMGHLEQPASVSPEREIADWVMQNRQSVLVPNILEEKQRWQFLEDKPPVYQSLLAVPMVLGEEVLGAMVLLHREAGGFMQEQIGLLEASARQISVALNKSELFKLIRDQAENLGSMLREQQIEANRSRAILEAVADGVVVTDHSNRITLLNRSAEEILGAKLSSLIEQPVEALAGLLGTDQAEEVWMGTIQNWVDTPQQFDESVFYSEQFELANGRYVAVSLAPVVWNEQFMGTVSIFRDVSHEVQVDRLKSEFIANVSHELRTPMTSIKGYAQVLLMGAAGDLTEQQRHFLEIISNNTSRLSVLVNDLLDVSRIEASRLALTLQPLNLRQFSEEMVQDMVKLSQEEGKPMMMEVRSQGVLPEVSGDPTRVRQIFNILLSNAYHYTPREGQIVVELHQEGQEVQVDIIDNGFGIPLEEQKHIFERFYRGENSLVTGTAGTGLGLSIAKTLVEMHLGRIWFRSSGIRGEGSVFSFTLPICEEKD